MIASHPKMALGRAAGGNGVRFVTVSFGNWDTHDTNFPRLKDQLLPPLDSGLSGLFLALEQKGLLESTTVFATGEFGRMPKINARGGRDPYPRAMFCLMAGGGIRGGQVVGGSDARGEVPLHDPITPAPGCLIHRSSYGMLATARGIKSPIRNSG